jgi:CheY-like chemotaxis protein
LKDILESFTFEVESTASGEEGLTEFESAAAIDQPYDLVIMDWKMPGMDGIEASKRIKNHTNIDKIPPIIMITAYGSEEIMHQAEQLRLEGLLFKPVNPSVLFDTIMQAMGEDVQKLSLGDHNKEQMPDDLAAIRGARVLLVEDNEINQQVAQEIIESAGLIVSVANNGEEGVRAVKEKVYDVVLMDIQMPVMNGYEATKGIRNWEGGMRNEGKDPIPIIAMTAHAMAGDEEKSLKAGMNDHVAKPVDPDQLFSTLRKWIKPIEERSQAQNPEAPVDCPEPGKAVPEEDELPESLPGFDIAAGLARLMGNKRLYRKLLLDFGANYGRIATGISQALEAKDFKQAHSLVHNLKGLAGNLEATNIHSSAVELEKLIKNADQRQMPAPEMLEQKVFALDQALNQALGSTRTLDVAIEDKPVQLRLEKMAVLPTELAQDTARRIRNAAKMGDVMQLVAIAEALKSQSEEYVPLSDNIIKLAQDFDFDGIGRIASKLVSPL